MSRSSVVPGKNLASSVTVHCTYGLAVSLGSELRVLCLPPPFRFFFACWGGTSLISAVVLGW